MTLLPFKQDVTFYDPNDDTVPLIGTVDGAGDPNVASFSTDPTHPRPYLKPILNSGGSEVNFDTGTGAMSQLTIDIVDKRRTANDQTSGIFTWLMAASTGDTALLGGRMCFRQVLSDGATMDKVLDGVVYSVKQNPTLASFKVVVRDIRERERKVRLFVKADTTTVFPVVAPKDGYGYNTQYDLATNKGINVGSPVLPAIQGIKAMYLQSGAFADGSYLMDFDFARYIGPDETMRKIWHNRIVNGLAEIWGDYFLRVPTIPGSSQPYYSPNIIVQWSVNSGGPWTDIPAPYVSGGGVAGQNNANTALLWFNIKNTPPNNLAALGWPPVTDDTFIPGSIRISRPAAGPYPVHGTVVYVRVLSNAAPTEKVPYYLEMLMGDLVKGIYDGGYSYPGLGMKMRYDAAAMTAYTRAAPKAIARITEPVDDGRAWLGENIWRPSRYAPSIRDGKVYPVSADLPDSALALPLIDDTVAYVDEAEWEHGSDLVVNHGEFLYERDLIPSNFSDTGKIITQPVLVQKDNATSQARHNAKPVMFQPVTVRSVLPFDVASGQTPDTMLDDAFKIALGCLEAIIRRRANGAQRLKIACRPSLIPNVYSGTWCQVAPSWMPDYGTRKRGINRVMQVVNIDKASPTKWYLTMLDGGPYSAPVTLPTITSVVENADNSVSIAVTGVPVTGVRPRAEVQFAYGESQPPTASGEWKTLALLDANGTAVLPTHPSGLLLWARVRGVADGARSSVWSVFGSLRLSSFPGILDFTARVNHYAYATNPGYAHVDWQALANAVGIRVLYEKHAKGTAPPANLTQHIDFAASALGGDIALLTQWEQMTIQLVPYTGFAAGAVSGTAGSATDRVTVFRRDDPYIKPTVREAQSRSGMTGTLTLTVDDPESVITKYEFSTRSGSSGSFSAYAQDNVAPYEQSVTLIPGQNSAIRYRVSGYNANGDEVVLAERVVEMGDDQLSTAQGTIGIRAGGEVDPEWDGPDIAASYAYAYSTSSFPSDATARGGTVVNGRQQSLSAVTTLAIGQSFYMTVIPYTGSGATGTELPSFRLRATRHDFSATKTVRYTASSFRTYANGGAGGFAENTTDLYPLGFAVLDAPYISGNITFPDGVTLTQGKFLIDDDGGQFFDMRFIRLDSSASWGYVLLSGFLFGGGTGQQAVAFSMAEATTGRRYRAVVIIDINTPASQSNSGFSGMEFTYTMPTSDKSL